MDKRVEIRKGSEKVVSFDEIGKNDCTQPIMLITVQCVCIGVVVSYRTGESPLCP